MSRPEPLHEPGEPDASTRRPEAAIGAASVPSRVSHISNETVALRLDEIAELLAKQRANPFRVRAYHRAAATLRNLDAPVAEILATGGVDALDRLPGIGSSLARSIRDVLRLGYSPMLHRLRGDLDPVRLFATIPGIGERTAVRLYDDLNLETLADLEAAAHDGRLTREAGFGQKRLSAVRSALADRLGRVWTPSASTAPSVAELLDVDREYREAAAADRLPKIAPRRFNPSGERWLPILHTTRGQRHYTALFSNTARAHRLGRTHDWVVVYADRADGDGQWTIVTAMGGPLKGRRIVRGREAECQGRGRDSNGRRSGSLPFAPVSESPGAVRS